MQGQRILERPLDVLQQPIILNITIQRCTRQMQIFHSQIDLSGHMFYSHVLFFALDVFMIKIFVVKEGSLVDFESN